jgi:acyl dehydratase
MEDLVKVGERFTDEARFSKKEITEFARLAGDLNPLHHDEEFAKPTRFSKRGASLGLEFTLRFRGPVRPGERLEMVWDVVDVTYKPKLNGEIVKLEGRVTNPAGEAVLEGTGTVQVARSL